MRILEQRAKIIQWIREFFYQHDFLETDTPSFVLSPGMEPHIRPIEVHALLGKKVFLPTSPEFAMKKIMAGGYSKIFQICKAYRLEPLSTTHNPEFTMLEWYRTNSGYEQIMDDVEALFLFITKKLNQTPRIWQRLSVNGCFLKFLGKPLTELFKIEEMARFCIEKKFTGSEILEDVAQKKVGLWDDLFFLCMMNGIEPELEKSKQPAILFNYPESQAALSNIVTDGQGYRWGKRFEVYAGGFELGNAFDELTDATIQRARFEKDMALRKKIYGDAFPPNPIDESFLSALSKIPPSGGIAMGIDRLVMYFTGATDIKEVLWDQSHW